MTFYFTFQQNLCGIYNLLGLCILDTSLPFCTFWQKIINFWGSCEGSVPPTPTTYMTTIFKPEMSKDIERGPKSKKKFWACFVYTTKRECCNFGYFQIRSYFGLFNKGLEKGYFTKQKSTISKQFGGSCFLRSTPLRVANTNF